MWCDELLRENLVFYNLVMHKIQKAQTPKDYLANLLEPKKVPTGTHVVYWNTNDEGKTYLMVA